LRRMRECAVKKSAQGPSSDPAGWRIRSSIAKRPRRVGVDSLPMTARKRRTTLPARLTVTVARPVETVSRQG